MADMRTFWDGTVDNQPDASLQFRDVQQIPI